MKTLNSFSLDFLKITEKSALACYPFIGQGDSMGADQAAVDAMRESFQQLDMDVQIVIGEGERDQAPRLYTGEKLGNPNSQTRIDVAVDPLEGTTICAEGREGSLSVMSVALRGKLFKAPDIYMKKIACGPQAKEAIDLNESVKKNVYSVCEALNKKPEDLVVGVLKRKRHQDLIEDLRKTKACIRLVGDGDVSLALETALENSPIDLLMGTGGAPEGVLAASALACLGGGFQGQLVYYKEEEKKRALECGLKDLDKIWKREELVSGETLFCATGVTKGFLLDGIRYKKGFWVSHSLILTAQGKKEVKNFHKKSV